MKNFIKSVLVSLFILINYNLKAQFITAIQGNNTFSLSVVGRATGNDILEKSGDVWEVTVWDDVSGNPGLGFNVNSSGTFFNNIALSNNDAYDTDVALTVDGSGDIHAIVVYFSQNAGGYVVEDFVWNTNTFNLNSGPTVFDIQSVFGTAVNVDAEYDGYFIVVWDVSGSPFGITGDVAGGTLNLNNVISIGSSATGIFPDVCINNRGNDRVTYCYIDASGDLIVDSDSYGNMGTSSTPTNELTTQPNDMFLVPRIACNDASVVGNAIDWTVVVMDTDVSSAYRIIGYSFNSSNLLNVVEYSNSTIWAIPGEDLKNHESYHPVVTYDDQGSIFVGWNYNNIPAYTSSTIDSYYPLVVACDYNGNPLFDYWNVPNSLSSGEIKDFLSLSGRHGVDVLFCSYYFQDNLDIETKAVYGSIGNGSLRSQYQNLDIMAIIKYNLIVNSKLYDLTGRLIIDHTENT